jgi:hypothetical protein
MTRASFAAAVALGLAVLIAIDGAMPLVQGHRPKLADLPFLIALVFVAIAWPLWRGHSWARIVGLVLGVLGIASGAMWLLDVARDSSIGFWAESYPGARVIEIVEWLGVASLVAALARPLASNNALERARNG